MVKYKTIRVFYHNGDCDSYTAFADKDGVYHFKQDDELVFSSVENESIVIHIPWIAIQSYVEYQEHETEDLESAKRAISFQ